MRKFSLAFSCLFFLFLAQNSFSQSMFLDLDDNGIGVNGSFINNADASMLAISPSIGLNGTFDIGFLYGKVTQKVKNADDISGSTISPFVNLLLLRPGEKLPFGMYLSGAYEKATYDYEYQNYEWYGPSESSGEIEVKALIYGIGSYYQIPIDNYSYLFPGIHISRVSSKTEQKDDDGFGINTEDVERTVVSLGIDFQRRISQNHSILFSTAAGITSDDSPSTISVSLGMLINLKLKQ